MSFSGLSEWKCNNEAPDHVRSGEFDQNENTAFVRIPRHILALKKKSSRDNDKVSGKWLGVGENSASRDLTIDFDDCDWRWKALVQFPSDLNVRLREMIKTRSNLTPTYGNVPRFEQGMIDVEIK